MVDTPYATGGPLPAVASPNAAVAAPAPAGPAPTPRPWRWRLDDYGGVEITSGPRRPSGGGTTGAARPASKETRP